ncbi:MAG: FAD-binding protein, partial [Cyclobacteriaceae bacterium]|nr:FAD-binding protein [Cyclobacteriaceae bacterium]
GEVRFNTRVSDLLIEDGVASGVKTADGETIKGQAVILATGHSARDIYELLHQRKVKIEAKPFALGVRVEHQQSLIDQIQYHCEVERGPYLPASAYALTHQSRYKGEKRGVFSFCMCPGGFIVPSATSPGEIVVNGMSPSRRDSRFANSGIVVSVENADFKKYEQYGPLAGMYFQKEVEQQAFKMAGGGQVAPAQRLVDFVNGKVSGDLLETSYQPGLAAVNMKEVLPDVVYGALRQGFKAFGKKMKGYLTDEAQVVGVESRTSSPVRIPRDPETLEHVEVKGLYPCGEGAGYAGGIVSAAMDGIKVVEAILV